MVSNALARRDTGVIVIENARLIFKNFAGKEGKYNRAGDRNFCVLLDQGLANVLTEDGWNVKYLHAREQGEEDQAYLPVAVGFEHRPPNIYLVTSKGRTRLNEDECEVVDWVDIKTTDVTIRPYSWSVNGKGGIKAYLKTLYVLLEEDYLDLKYADLDELPARAGKVDDGLAISDRPHFDFEGEVVDER